MSTVINKPAQPRTVTAVTPRSTNRFLYIIVFCMLPLSGILSCKSNDKPSQQAQAPDPNIALRDSLQSQYNAAGLKLDQLATDKAQLDSMITAKDAEITKLKSQVKRLGKDNKELTAKLKKDTEFINSLKAQLSDKAREYAESLGLLQADKDNLTRQNDDLQKKYNALHELGSVLDASNFRLEPIHTKHHGKKEKETKRARRVDIFRVIFDIDENRIAEDGLKKLYAVITDPDGKLLSNPEISSGTITAANGTTINYSVLKEIELKQNEPLKNVVIDYSQDSDYKKGDYTIGVYNGGYRIGGGKVTLR